MMNWLKSLAPRDGRAWVALIFSVGGTMALTAILVWIIFIYWKGGWPISTAETRIEKLSIIAILIAVIMGLTMTGVGLAINPRRVKAGALGASFEASGGDEPTATTIAAAAGAAAGAAATVAASTEEPK